MEFISELPLVGGFLSSALAFVVVLGVVVFVHEFGHYIVGRWCGIHADVFSLGFGPKIYGWDDSRGTHWQVSALPLGGYVKFKGDADGSSRADPEQLAAMSEEDRANSFHGASVGRRAATVAAGPFANFILSALVFAGLVMWSGVPAGSGLVGEVGALPGEPAPELRRGDRLLAVEGQEVTSLADLYDIADVRTDAGTMAVTVEREGERLNLTIPHPMPPLVQAVEPLSAAAAAGLKTDDYIRRVAGERIDSFAELREAVMATNGETVTMEVVRGDEVLDLEITPRLTDRMNPDGTVERRVVIGVTAQTLVYPLMRTPMPWEALQIGATQVWDVITLSLTGIGHLIWGNIGPENLQGPLGIAQVSGQSATQGVDNLISLIAVISTAIGLLNLFPIPVLDGGHLVFFGYEAVVGRPPADQVLRIAMTLGLAMVLLLMVFATYNDLMRLAIS